MRLSLVFTLLFVTLAAGAKEPSISLHHLTGPLYVVIDTHYAKTNSLIYIGPSSVTLIGATWTMQTAATLARKIRKITAKPVTEVVNPSDNPEYAGGNGYWKQAGAQIISTRLTYRVMKQDWVKVGNFVRSYFPDYPHVSLVLPTVVHQGNFELQNGHIRAMYLGPSHTADDIFVYFPTEKVLYAGSILKKHIGNLAFANLGEYRKTLHKLQSLHLDIRWIISGHWSAVHGPGLIDHYLKLLETHSQRNNRG